MRTTVEITNEQRSRLLALAARRGQRGFSQIVREAIDAYLSSLEDDDERLSRARAARGTLDEDEARELAESCARIRETWR